MRKIMIAVGLVVFVFFGATSVFAHGFGKMYNLNPEQKTKLQELRQKFYDETRPLRESIFAKRKELRSLWVDPKADSDAILQKEKEVRDLQDQMRDRMVQFRLEARDTLTPEQIGELGKGWKKGPRGYKGGHGFGRGYCY